MIPLELAICKNIYDALVASQYPSSPEYEKWQHLSPKETTQNLSYLSIVKHPSEYKFVSLSHFTCTIYTSYPIVIINNLSPTSIVDFEIISNKFKSRAYANKEDFYADIQLMFDNAKKFYLNPLAIESAMSLEVLFTRLKKEHDNGNENCTSNGSNGVNGSAAKQQVAAAAVSQQKPNSGQRSSLSSAVKPTSHPTLNGAGSSQGGNLKFPPEQQQKGKKSNQMSPQRHQNSNLKPSTEYDESISYINNVKNRFAAQPKIHSEFMKLLDTYIYRGDFEVLVEEVESLFGDHRDLIMRFEMEFDNAAKLVTLSKQAVGLVEAQTYIETIEAKGLHDKFTTILDAYELDMYQYHGLLKLVDGIASLFKDDADLRKGFARFLPKPEHVKDQFQTLVGEANAQLNVAVEKGNQVRLKHQQQRLLLLRHASKCPHNGQCPDTPHCAGMKVLWKHIADCKDSVCKVKHCTSSRYVLSHYQRCKDVRCELCGPVREAITRATEKHKKLEEEKKSKKRKASSSPANGAPPSKRNSIDDDAKFAADLQQLEERWEREDQMMLSTSMGRAYKFVERVTSEVYSLERNQGNVGITSVAKDDMVQMAERMLMLIDTLFDPVGKNTNVDLGFHFTSEDSMGHIQRDGLMTLDDRVSNPKLNSQEARHKHGGVFGDGVYTGKIWYFSYASHLYLLLMYLSLFL